MCVCVCVCESVCVRERERKRKKREKEEGWTPMETVKVLTFTVVYDRAREIAGFAGSGPIFETENRFISRQEAKKSVHKTLDFSRFCNTQTDIVTCQNCSHLIIRCYMS